MFRVSFLSCHAAQVVYSKDVIQIYKKESVICKSSRDLKQVKVEKNVPAGIGSFKRNYKNKFIAMNEKGELN